MSEREDYDRLADELGAEADKLAQENKRLEEEIGDARQDWERKRSDAGVPGAPPPEDGDRAEAPDEVDPKDDQNS
jgi:hypothetical protein